MTPTDPTAIARRDTDVALTLARPPERREPRRITAKTLAWMEKHLGIPFKDARAALAKSEATHPAPDGCDREGKHQWGSPERNREVCVNCGATRVLEGGSAGEPVAWWVHDLHVARQPVKARARYPEPTEFLYPASREQDARNAAKMLGGKCTPLFALSALTAGGDDG